MDVDEPEEENGWWSRERAQVIVLFIFTAILVFYCYRIAEPFMPAITWAVALAVIAYPLHRWICPRVSKPWVSASISVFIVAALIVAPTIMVFRQVVHETSSMVKSLSSDGAESRWRTAINKNEHGAKALAWVEQRVKLDDTQKQAATMVAASASKVVRGSVVGVAQLLFMLFVLFFLLRDREQVLKTVRSMLPLTRAEIDRLFKRVSETIHGTIYGTVIVGIVQGVLGGLMFWWLGLPAPLLWGMVMALIAILPLAAPFIIWVPAAAFLALEGNYGKAAILALWGILVIGLVDNILYPLLVGKRMRMHTVVVFIAIIGGLLLFGPSGMVLGPVILSITIGLIDIWRSRTADGGTAETPTSGKRIVTVHH